MLRIRFEVSIVLIATDFAARNQVGAWDVVTSSLVRVTLIWDYFSLRLRDHEHERTGHMSRVRRPVGLLPLVGEGV